MKLEDTIVYEIYVKSFNDSNGDGIGDINGITEKLDYIKKLGVNFIWLTPIYPSPMNDNGYDVKEYCSINPIFGTMADFDNLLHEAKKRGIEIMLDMVLNHSSTEHSWFQKALQGDKNMMDYYIFKDPINGKEPTNWQSKFGGSVWEYVKELDKYYLHLFDKTQADLNWDNPELRKELYKIVNFWLNRGVKGFRFDVINLISKPIKYEDDTVGDGRKFYTDGPNIHLYLKELAENTYGKFNNSVTVGEMSSTTVENCIKYSNPKEKELSMTFNFHHLKVDYDNGDKWSLKQFDVNKLKQLFDSWQTKMSLKGGHNALFFSNHDQPRIVSRFGNDKEFRAISAKMLATSVFLMRGTPYIYQGEELGMTNAHFENINQYEDIESKNQYNILKEKGVSEKEILTILSHRSRDNSRTPIQWDSTENAGFTTSNPWLAVNKNYRKINAEYAMSDPNSIFNYFKKLIALRKNNTVLKIGEYVKYECENSNLFAYKRVLNGEEMIIISNYSSDLIKENIDSLVDYKIALSNYDNHFLTENMLELKPYETVVLYKNI